MNYNLYLKSDEWRKKRKLRLRMDKNRCRLCAHDGSKWQLEIHHCPDSYERLGNESVSADLITICSRCHMLVTAIIRQDRKKKLRSPFGFKGKATGSVLHLLEEK